MTPPVRSSENGRGLRHATQGAEWLEGDGRMKVSGFTIVKDAVKFHFPAVESIRSMVPVCDEVIVNVGLPDTDGTLQMVEEIEGPQVKVFTTEWDPLFV